MDKKLNEEKVYRAQFEDDDSSLRSFKEERSGQPSTPQAGKRPGYKFNFGEKSAKATDEELPVPKRTGTDIVSIFTSQNLML